MDVDVSGWQGLVQEPRPTKTPDLTKAPVSLLFVAADLVARAFAETVGRRYNLTLPEWRCMMVLASRPGLANVEVAEASGVDVMTVSRALRRLEQHRRLERRADPTDKRRITGSLTARGLDLFRTVAASDEFLLGELKSQDRAQLSRYLKSIIASLR
ncbi:MAG: MarR family transcriptional regulator [Hyphomicrobiales bacterium]|nr:MarR family transcriptional regulator [Hyphomicrobiales bacterium]MBV8767594.1 MarR family transcriptional regulator [Hyphomicrobiales bacterium]MBV9053420.1 MarR family transcriptional regulator [Hyphomicrobiales bacterium]MBV9137940.1 MarR family transcriptional regulator [Hyphomicrobiales bacterium]MBV9978082.1 MarR family transcriptional regulator [Hyphomicrobiales bacterium]